MGLSQLLLRFTGIRKVLITISSLYFLLTTLQGKAYLTIAGPFATFVVLRNWRATQKDHKFLLKAVEEGVDCGHGGLFGSDAMDAAALSHRPPP